MATVALLTDFGLQDTYVGVMKGVIASIARDAAVVDVCHAVPPQDVENGARMLLEALPYFPRGTIFVVVVDPGVGSTRRAVAIQTEHAILVGPDNGVLYPASRMHPLVAAVELRDARFHLPDVSTTFHGRDVFSPVAAHLAAGVDVQALGPTVDALTPLTLSEAVETAEGLVGRVVRVDAFGNLLTDIPNARLMRWLGDSRAQIHVGSIVIHGISRTFADVDVGAPVAYAGSSGVLEVAVRNGDARSLPGAARGAEVRVTRVPAS